MRATLRLDDVRLAAASESDGDGGGHLRILIAALLIDFAAMLLPANLERIIGP